MKTIRKLISLLLVVAIAASVYLLTGASYSANTSFLVLIETQKGKWTAYKDMVLYSPQNNPMLKLSEFCDAMDYDYSSINTKKQFSIAKNDKVKNVYTKDKKEYISYLSNGTNKKITAKGNAYYDKTIKANLCDASSVSSICYVKSFNTSGTAYGDLEYEKIMCFSKFTAIKALPDIMKISYDSGTPLYEPGPVYKSSDGKWLTKLFYMDGILNGERNRFYITHRSSDYDVNEPKIEFTSSSHNEVLDKEDPEIAIIIGKSAQQGVSYTKDTLGSETVDIEIVIFKGISGTIWDYDFIKEATIRFDTLDREEGTIAGYIKIVAENDQREKAHLEGYFADNIFSHSKALDSARYTKVKELRSGNNGNSSLSNSGSSSSSGNSGSINSNVKLTTVPCTSCGGTGKITCSICHGVGYKESMGYRYGEYGKIVDPCLVCGGAGAKLCSTCGGSGSVTKLSSN